MFNLSYILQEIINGKSMAEGCVNFIASDIDEASSTVSLFTRHLYNEHFI